jgi:hypothetical protein
MPQRDDPNPGEGRLYVPEHEPWKAAIKHDWNKEYCYSQRPGENFYHLLVTGEIYLQRGTDKFCLSCALRNGYATRDRSHWLQRPSSVVEDQSPRERSE